MCRPSDVLLRTTISDSYRNGCQPKQAVRSSLPRRSNLLESDIDQRWQCLRRTATRVAAWPMVLLLGVVDAVSHIVYEEHPDYRMPAGHSQAEDECAVHRDAPCALARSASNASSSTSSDSSQRKRDRSRLILQRFVECAKVSGALLAQSIMYIGFLHLFSFFGIEALLFSFRADIERAIAWLTGSAYVLADGTRIPFTLMGALDPVLSVPYCPGTGFPFSGSRAAHAQTGAMLPAVDTPRNAHFMAMCSKLIYEDDRVVRSVIEDRWGMTHHEGHRIPNHWFQECWKPDIVWCAASNSRALVLMVKGADPIYQLDLRADPPCAKRPRPGMGEVHCGLWHGLHQADPWSEGSSVLDTLMQMLTVHGVGKEVFLCGHSLGGALAALLALHIPARAPGLRVGGIFTFGQPRFCDLDAADIAAKHFGGRIFRYVHAADLVCKLPPAWGFAHLQQERFITSFPVADAGGRRTRILREEHDARSLREWEAREDRWGYAFSLAKLFANARSEPMPRLGARAALLLFPGFSDHAPCDYERALREELP